jgi:hypothetical protein
MKDWQSLAHTMWECKYAIFVSNSGRIPAISEVSRGKRLKTTAM